jgi:hypothetical protein
MFDSSSRTRIRGLVLAAICAAALGLAACGDDDDDAATTTDTAVETTETTDSGDTTTETTETTDTGETAETEGDVTELLRSQLEAAGIQPDQAECVIDELESTLDEDTLEELRDAQEAPQEVIDASTAAAQKCLGQ